MKKSILSILISAVILLSACSSAQSDAYDVRLTANIEGGVFKNSVEIFNIDSVSTTEYSNPIESEITLGAKELVADLISVKDYTHKSKQNVYLSKDKNTEYRKNADYASFTIQAKNGTVLMPFEKETLSEQTLKSFVIDFMAPYVNPNELKNYTYNCDTSVIVTKQTASWKETKDTFYLPQNDTEIITAYEIEFRKYCQGFSTSDSIVFKCNANGDVTGFYYYEHNVNWENSSFDEESVKNSVDEYLNNNLSKDFTLIECSIQTKQLVYLDCDIQLAIAAELTLLNNSEEIVVLCPLLLSNPK